MNKDKVLICDNLHKFYPQAQGNLRILQGISFDLNYGQSMSVVGTSGSGKSTLLHLLAGLDQLSQGAVTIDGANINKLNDNQVSKLRNTKLGFIYQFHHLLPEFSALENVLMPLIIAGYKVNSTTTKHAKELLEYLGLSNRLTHYPSQLSGGERQRVAIARAVINQPKIVFADEPTGNLDSNTANSVLEVFLSLQKELKTSLIIVTHDLEVAKRTDLQYTLKNCILYNPDIPGHTRT